MLVAPDTLVPPLAGSVERDVQAVSGPLELKPATADSEAVLAGLGYLRRTYARQPGLTNMAFAVMYREWFIANGWRVIDAPRLTDPAIESEAVSISAANTANGRLLFGAVRGDAETYAISIADVEAEDWGAALDAQCHLPVYGIDFDLERPTLRPDATPILEKLAATLIGRKGTPVEVQGHTDNRGDDSSPPTLSDGAGAERGGVAHRARRAAGDVVGEGVWQDAARDGERLGPRPCKKSPNRSGPEELPLAPAGLSVFRPVSPYTCGGIFGSWGWNEARRPVLSWRVGMRPWRPGVRPGGPRSVRGAAGRAGHDARRGAGGPRRPLLRHVSQRSRQGGRPLPGGLRREVQHRASRHRREDDPQAARRHDATERRRASRGQGHRRLRRRPRVAHGRHGRGQSQPGLAPVPAADARRVLRAPSRNSSTSTWT